MIIVIQCAKKKKEQAGCMQRSDGRKVLFVADPEKAPAVSGHCYAHPDDTADTGRTWREELVQYNNKSGSNPLGLLPAWELYEHDAYKKLANQYGIKNLYILSAGWGLIRGDFLTPQYDITFSGQAPKHTRRRKTDWYDDLRTLPEDTTEPIVFFVGKGYIPLACELTTMAKAKRYLYYNSNDKPTAPGCILEKYDTRTRTNWHYECARAFMDGKIRI
ncbi:MAG: hypothetical protein ACR2P9_06565 [Gammaproteobacteria bacterium]